MSKIIDILKSKWLKDAGKSAIVIAVIIIIFLAMNLIIMNIDPDDIDLSENKLYTLTDESKELISKIPDEDKIDIYMFDFPDNDLIVDLAKQYSKIKENIKVEKVEMDDRPDLVSKYNIEAGYYTVLLVAGEKSKTLTYYDFFALDYATNQTNDLTEQRLTNAILSLSSIGRNTPVYFLTGHGERTIDNDMIYFKQYLSLENYEAKSLDLLSAETIPEDCETLVIASPTKDFTEVEAKAIRDYIKDGGSILWLCDSYSGASETPNIKSVLDLYGVNIRQDGFVLEQDSDKMIMGSADLVLASVQDTTFTQGMEKVLLIDTGILEFSENMVELNVGKTDLLKTSKNSFFRTNIQDTSLMPSEGEEEGEKVVGALLERTTADDTGASKLVIVANNAFVADKGIFTGSQYMPGIGFYDNKDFVMGMMKHLADVEDTLTISKSIKPTIYTATSTQDTIITIVIFVLPVIIIVAGVIVWLLRRRKK